MNHLGVPLPRRDPNFLDCWQVLRRRDDFQAGVNLTVQLGMDRLNRARNNLKHVGALPGREAVDYALCATKTFFEDNTKPVFGVAFDAIDMADVDCGAAGAGGAACASAAAPTAALAHGGSCSATAPKRSANSLSNGGAGMASDHADCHRVPHLVALLALVVLDHVAHGPKAQWHETYNRGCGDDDDDGGDVRYHWSILVLHRPTVI